MCEQSKIDVDESAPERVSVPVELLKRIANDDEGLATLADFEELRALLASHYRYVDEMNKQCVNCPGATDHSTAECPIPPERAAFMEQYPAAKSLGWDGAQFVAARNSQWQQNACEQLNLLWQCWKRARASLPVGVPAEFRKVADKILANLIRFADCAEDFEAGGVDIGRDWLDTLTHLGLLERVQRSPALWQATDEADAIIDAQRAILASHGRGEA